MQNVINPNAPQADQDRARQELAAGIIQSGWVKVEN